MLSQLTLDALFTYHPTNERTAPKYEAIRDAEERCRKLALKAENYGDVTYNDVNEALRHFASVIDENAPECADKSAAIRCVRLARNALNEHLTGKMGGVLAIATQQIIMARWQACSAVALEEPLKALEPPAPIKVPVP